MEERVIELINLAKEEFENYECKLKKYKRETNLGWHEINNKGEREKICNSCLLGQANADIYDINDNDTVINICTLLDVMDYLEV